MLSSREATNTNFVVFHLTRSGLEPTFYHNRDEHANHYTTYAFGLDNFHCIITRSYLCISFSASFFSILTPSFWKLCIISLTSIEPENYKFQLWKKKIKQWWLLNIYQRQQNYRNNNLSPQIFEHKTRDHDISWWKYLYNMLENIYPHTKGANS